MRARLPVCVWQSLEALGARQAHDALTAHAIKVSAVQYSTVPYRTRLNACLVRLAYQVLWPYSDAWRCTRHPRVACAKWFCQPSSLLVVTLNLRWHYTPGVPWQVYQAP